MAISAGSARANITPPVGTPMAGFGARKDVSRGIHDELYAKALVVTDDSESAVIITADLIGLSAETVAHVRKKIEDSTGVPSRSILVSASHTHSGPAVVKGYGGFGLAAEHYRETLIDQLAGAAISAWNRRTPARLGWGAIDLYGVGVNRRNAAGVPVDPSVGVLKVAATDGSSTVIFTNYTCHPVTLGPDNLLVSADYPGYAVRLIERIYGERTTAMFANGAAGDINTGHSADLSALGYHIPGRTFERAQSLGTRLAGAVLTGTECIELEERSTIRSLARVVALEAGELPDLTAARGDLEKKRERLRALETSQASEADLTKARVDELYASLLVDRIEESKNEEVGSAIEIELQGIRLGTTVLLAIPVELFVEIGLRVKKASQNLRVCICGYSNGSYGYLPSKAAFEEGGYEAVSSRFSSDAAQTVEDALVEMAAELSAAHGTSSLKVEDS